MGHGLGGTSLEHSSSLLNKYGLGELDTVTVLSGCWLGATSDHPRDQETVVTNT